MHLEKSHSIIKPPESEKIKAGFVTLQPGTAIGEHETKNCEEIIVIIEGKASLIVGEKERTLEKGDTGYIPKNILHNVINRTKSTLKYYYIVALH